MLEHVGPTRSSRFATTPSAFEVTTTIVHLGQLRTMSMSMSMLGSAVRTSTSSMLGARAAIPLTARGLATSAPFYNGGPPTRPKGVRRPRRVPPSKIVTAPASTVTATTKDGTAEPEYPPSLKIFLHPDPNLEVPPLPFATSVNRAAEEANKIPLSYLSVPLGVKDKPIPGTGASLAKVSAIKDPKLKAEALAYQKKILLRQMGQTYFYDLHAMRSHGGKLWRGPSTMIREDQALYFPDIVGVNLKDRANTNTTSLLQGKVSVVSVLTSRLSGEHINSFVQPNLQRFVNNKGFNYVQLNLQQNTLKSYLVSLFLSGLRKEVPEPWQPSYVFARQNMELLRPRLGLHNQYVGYVYLVDEQCKVRWAGCAFAEQEEREALWASVGVLLDRLGKGKKV